MVAFIGGGWLIVEFVHWILIDHFRFPEQTLDITLITLICVLICTLIWRLFSGVEKKPRKIKMEFIIIPLVILITAFFDIRFIQQIGEAEEAAISTPEWKNSIAVLPFKNISADEEQEYFCDGLTEELINTLSNIKELKVVARTSTFAFKGEKIDIREVGQKLGVDKVLEGSVRKTGSRIRITAQLINAADGYHLWSEKYDRKIEDVFAIQDEISLEIVDKLRLELLGEVKSKLTKRYTEDFVAYNLYLKGRFFWNKRTKDGFKKSIEYLEQSIKKDPSYALAYAGLADCYNLLGTYNHLPPKEAYPKAKEAAQKALSIDSTLAEAHTSLAYILMDYELDWDGAIREYERAIQLNPNYGTAHQWYANSLSRLGRHDEAIAEAKKARELDPLSPIINRHVGYRLYFAHQYDQAIEESLKALKMFPDFHPIHLTLGSAYLQKGMFSKALAEFQKANNTAGLGYAYALSGNQAKAQMILNDLKERSKDTYVPSTSIARIYIGLGDKDHAIEWLDKAYEERSPGLINLKVNPIYDPLRSDPRFKALLKKMGLE